MRSELRNSANLSLKIIVVGQGGVGKTKLISRYINDECKENCQNTIGMQLTSKKVEVNGQEVNVQIWDTAGQEKFRCLNKNFYRNSIGALIVFSLDDRETFQKLQSWIQQINQIVQICPLMLLIGNKLDKPNRKISVTQIMKFAKDHEMGYMQTSASENFNVKNAFETLIKLSHSTYFDKKKLKSERSQIISSISMQKIKKKSKCC